MAIQTTGLNYLADGIGQATTLTLRAYNAALTLLDSVAVTYTAATGGDAVLATSNPTLTIAAGETVTSVDLYSSAALLAKQALTTDNAFPNGGDLIITSYTISVT